MKSIRPARGFGFFCLTVFPTGYKRQWTIAGNRFWFHTRNDTNWFDRFKKIEWLRLCDNATVTNINLTISVFAFCFKFIIDVSSIKFVGIFIILSCVTVAHDNFRFVVVNCTLKNPFDFRLQIHYFILRYSRPFFSFFFAQYTITVINNS